MDAQKASYSITLMASVLGVTRAGYYAWKNRAPQRGKRASARRRLDEAVAGEHDVSGGTYGPPCVRHALARAGVDVGVRAVAASMRRQGLTGLNTHPRPAKRGGRGPVAHEDLSSPGFCGGLFRPLPFVLLCVGFLLVAG